jgi:hypothetical protein
MTWLVSSIVLAVMPSPAFAAGLDAPLAVEVPILIGMFALFFALPSIGLGYCLQGLMSLRNAAILLVGVLLTLWTALATIYGFEKTQSASMLFATTLLLFCPLFALGWHLGIRDTKRGVASQKLA